MSIDIKTDEQIKISLAAIRLHGHIKVWLIGFIFGFAMWFWFGLSPRPQLQAGIFYDLAASFIRWLGVLSWFPSLNAVYIQDARVSLWPYLIPCVIAGVIVAAAALLLRLYILGILRRKPFAPSRDSIIRGVNASGQSLQSMVDEME